jgi:hypothetical protein
MAAVVARSPEPLFDPQLIDAGVSETCAVADFNRDGKLDIFSGDSWYQNPSWRKHKVRDIREYGTYLATLSDLPLDVDGDGNVDVVSAGWHTKQIWWSRNPGGSGAKWTDQVVFEGYPVEFAFLVDLNNDGAVREILPQFGNEKAALVWFEAKDGTLRKHTASPRSYGHGIGAGDVNGDGRNDIVTPQGWLEAPADPRSADWQFHPEFQLGATGFIHVIDINRDGRPDLLTGMGHDYGVFWMENNGGGKWMKRDIDKSWSQAHALTLTDINSDGRPDLVTGKRFHAHDGKDPGGREPLGIFWYEFSPPSTPGGAVTWFRHVISYGGREGAGMDIPVVDFNGDGQLDFAVGGKSGLFVFLAKTR